MSIMFINNSKLNEHMELDDVLFGLYAAFVGVVVAYTTKWCGLGVEYWYTPILKLVYLAANFLSVIYVFFYYKFVKPQNAGTPLLVLKSIRKNWHFYLGWFLLILIPFLLPHLFYRINQYVENPPLLDNWYFIIISLIVIVLFHSLVWVIRSYSIKTKQLNKV